MQEALDGRKMNERTEEKELNDEIGETVSMGRGRLRFAL